MVENVWSMCGFLGDFDDFEVIEWDFGFRLLVILDRNNFLFVSVF